MHAFLIHAGALGDFIMALRIVEAMRRAGATHITVLGRPSIARVAVPGGGVDETIDIETGGFHTLFSKEMDIPIAVRRRLAQFDLAVDMLGGKSPPVAARLTQVGVRRVLEIDPTLRNDWTGHVTDQWLTDLAMRGLAAHPGPPRIDVDANERRRGRDGLARSIGKPSRTIALVHPGSGSPAKRWPLENFLTLTNQLQYRGIDSVFLLGPVEAERLDREDVIKLECLAPVLADPPLVELRGLLAACDVFIGNDSGVSHLAAAVGAHTVVVFGPTDPAHWGPIGPRAHTVQPAPTQTWPTVVKMHSAVTASLERSKC